MNNSQDQVDDGKVKAENRLEPKRKEEPKRATKKLANERTEK